MAIASSSAAMIFKIMLDPTIGIVNKLLKLDINWIQDPKYALISVAVLTAWLNSGINFLYFFQQDLAISMSRFMRGQQLMGQMGSRCFLNLRFGVKPNIVLYGGSKYNPGFPVVRTGKKYLLREVRERVQI